MRLLFRWQDVRRRGPRIPVVTVATAIAMVGALILEPGIAARTPDVISSQASTTAGLGVPGTPFHRVDRILVMNDPGAAEVGPVPASISELNVPLDAWLQARDADPLAFFEWMAHYVAIAQQVARDAALTSALDGTMLDSVTPGARAFVAAAPSQAAAKQKPATKRAPHPHQQPNPPPGHGSGPDGIWNVAPIVTWYGPGFYGNRTACGQRYTRTIIGVAHRTLPCGTLVEFRWHGMTAVAPVIDRGPYASAAYVFDWSAALACRVFKPKGVSNSCFTRHDVQWRVVGRRNH